MKDVHERGLMHRSMNVLMAAGLVLSPVSVVVTNIQNEAIAASEAEYEAKRADACGGNPTYNPAYHDTDEQALPALDKAIFKYDNDGIARIGSIIVGSSAARWRDGKSPLPEPHTKGLLESFTDPYVACTSQDYSRINIKVNREGFDLPGYRATDGVLVKEPQVDLTIGAGEQPGQIFEKRGSIRAVLVHENTHSVFDKWTKSKDPNTQHLLQELESLHQAEYLAVNEQFRAEHGKEIAAKLRQMQEQFEQQGQHDSVKAIDLTIKRYGQEHGLDSLAFVESADTGHKQSATIERQVWLAAKELGVTAQTLGDHAGINMQPLYEAQSMQYDYLAEAYAYVNEGKVLPFAGGVGGQSATSLNEKIASTVTSAHIMPQTVRDRTQQLGPNRRSNVQRQQELILKLYKQENPTLVQFMGLSSVASH